MYEFITRDCLIGSPYDRRRLFKYNVVNVNVIVEGSGGGRLGLSTRWQ